MKQTSAPGTDRYQIVSEINMIPLIDVALVVLIIFMVITPQLLRSRIPIDLPKANQVDTQPPAAGTVEIQVREGGTLFVNGRQTSNDALSATLRRSIKDPAIDGILVLADKTVPFEQFVGVVDVARQVGVVKFGIAVRRQGEGSPGSGGPAR